MKQFLKLISLASLFWCLIGSFAHAQGCNNVDKYRLGYLMGVNGELIPLLNFEIPNCSNIYLGDSYVGFVLNELNEKLNNGIRSEMSIDYPFVEDDTVEYRWSIMVPPQNALGENVHQWWVIAQWHDQPDPRLHETWPNFKKQSPPVAIYVEKREARIGIGIQGLQGKKLSWTAIPTGTWLNLHAIIHWSTSENGSVKFSVDEHPEFDFETVGRNMLNSYQHYFKVGQYRDPSVNRYAVIYIKDVRIKKL